MKSRVSMKYKKKLGFLAKVKAEGVDGEKGSAYVQ